MTRDEHRAKCIEWMMIVFGKNLHLSSTRELITRVFDAQHDLAFVVPYEVTEEMIIAAASALFAKLEGVSLVRCRMLVQCIQSAMSVAGDLTNPPEKKT